MWFQSTEDDAVRSVNAALEAGYRYIDTANFYANEKAIGRVLKDWMDTGKVKREDLFIVTKVILPCICYIHLNICAGN